MKYLWLALWALSSFSHAAMYKCQQNGTVQYQDQPCAAVAKSLPTKVNHSPAFNPNEFRLAATPPSAALFRELIGTWCEDDQLMQQQISALMGQAKTAPRPPTEASSNANYGEAMAQKALVTIYANQTANESGHSVKVTLGREGFEIGTEGLTIYRHGEHFYRGSHEFHRIPLKRCSAQ